MGLNNDLKTTGLGMLLMFLQLYSVNFGKLPEGEVGEVVKVVGAFGTGLLGYFINKKDKR